LQEWNQVLVEVTIENAQTLFHNFDCKLNDVIQVHELLDDIRDKNPNLLEEFRIWILLALREIMALFKEMSNKV